MIPYKQPGSPPLNTESESASKNALTVHEKEYEPATKKKKVYTFQKAWLD